ncbi:hypothetical protein EXN66_Car013965 [Channa argus]|uniref:Uncharacterized protein n=1 Tax=Channa argus TaxID=215402 RepID=A0A6G1Q7A1_CHAAH|nr:hypothetical protein EXN66_Car022558 [Channa argus]KAF3698284.1 hypothetical protein EXN66_Car013965 [Channa argus]
MEKGHETKMDSLALMSDSKSDRKTDHHTEPTAQWGCSTSQGHDRRESKEDKVP